MQDNSSVTSAPGSSLLPDGIAALTTIHFVLIGILAVLTIAGIIWGVRQKRLRDEADRDVVANAEDAGIAPVAPAESEAPVAEAPAPEATLPKPVPVAPAPPPIAEPVKAAPSVAPAAAPAPSAPVQPAPPPIAEPTPASAAPAATPAPTAFADGPVTQLKGLGPKVAARLAEAGVTTIGQIAALDDAQAQALDAQLGTFAGRMARDRWVDQARLLAAGDRAGFEAVFGKL